MKIRLAGVLATLVFVALPFFTHAATLAELQSQLQSLLAQLAILQAQLPQQETPQNMDIRCPYLNRDLSRGMRGNDVKQLQQFLIYQNFLAAGNNTGYFGKLTQAAVQSWQKKNGIVSSGSPSTNGYGAVGPRTRAAIATRVCGGSSATATSVQISSGTTNTGTSQGGTTNSANFSTSPISGTVPLRVVFRTNVEWSSPYFIDFGDGHSSPLRNNCPGGPIGACGQPTAEHIYSNPGTYTAQLIKSDPGGCGAITDPRCLGAPASRQIIATVSIVVSSSSDGGTSPPPPPPPAPQSCAFAGSTVAHGTSVNAYQSSSVTYASQCVSQSRTCSNGSLSGTYTYSSCSVNSPSQTISPTNQTVIVPTARALYSPAVFTTQGVKRMLTGGWLTEADPQNYETARAQGVDLTTIPGADKIFLSEMNGSTWSAPTLVFQKTGYHVNDPSVIHPPSDASTDRSQWLYMYYTALDNRVAATSIGQVQQNQTGLASSVDEGRTWSDVGIVLAVADGGDGYGAWSPTAVISPDNTQIWVYYHTGKPDFSQPIMFRQRFNLNGIQRIGSPERLVFPGSSNVVNLSNLDVQRVGSQFVLLGNTLDLNNIMRYVSNDGLNWTQSGTVANPLVGGGVNQVLTPTQEILDSTHTRLYFGFQVPGQNTTSIHAWDLTLPNTLAQNPPRLSNKNLSFGLR